MEDNSLRDQIADTIREFEDSRTATGIADEILAIPEIAEALASKSALSEIEAFGYANSGHGFRCARMASKALGNPVR